MDKKHNCTCPKCGHKCSEKYQYRDYIKKVKSGNTHFRGKPLVDDLLCRCVNCPEMIYSNKYECWLEFNIIKNMESIEIPHDWYGLLDESCPNCGKNRIGKDHKCKNKEIITQEEEKKLDQSELEFLREQNNKLIDLLFKLKEIGRAHV